MLFRKFMTAIFAISALAGQAQEKQFSIIPESAEITVVGEGTVQIERGMLVRVSDSSLVASADFLADYTNRYLGIPLRVDVPKKGKKRTADKAVNGIVLVNRNNGEVSGGYRLEVIPGTGIRIEGNDAAGVFYGVQTLIQMLPVRAGVLPILVAAKVVDYPRFAYRGMHLDVVRHFFPVEFIKKYIDYLALHKLNYFHWHLTDDQAWRVEMKCRPELTAKGSVREGERIVSGKVSAASLRRLLHPRRRPRGGAICRRAIHHRYTGD